MMLVTVSALLSLWSSGASRSVQDPNDPLVYGPGISGGARLQFGINVFPADWSYGSGLREKFTLDSKLPGYQILNLQDPRVKPSSLAVDGFVSLPCEFDGTTPVVTVFAQNGQRYKFILDSGSQRCYIKPSLAATLNNGNFSPFPMALMLAPQRWLHFKTEVDPRVAVLSSPSSGFPEDGILGMNALACLQLKIDYRLKKAWTRVSSMPLVSGNVDLAGKSPSAKLETIPMRKQDSGRYSIGLTLNGMATEVEVDTGANLIGLNASAVSNFGLDKVGDGSVVVESGQSQLNRFLAASASVGEIKFLWPVIHGGRTQDPNIGGFGPSVFPHQAVLIDYPGQQLYTVAPTDDEKVEQALGQFIAGVVRIEPSETVLDMQNILGTHRAVLLKVQDQPVASVIADLRAMVRGDAEAKARLIALYKTVTTQGHITFRQDGLEKTIDIAGE